MRLIDKTVVARGRRLERTEGHMANGWIASPETVLHVTGRLDGTSVSEARQRLHTAIATTGGDVIVDVSDMEWVDVTGLAVLVDAHRRLRSQDRRLVLRGCGPRVRRALAVTRLSRVMSIERGESTPSAA
jgi:anti-sigma B factor antagonist